MKKYDGEKEKKGEVVLDPLKTGRFIAQRRKEKHMTQKELADRLGITNKAVSKWETGQGMPDIGVLLDLARLLDVSVEELLQGGADIKEEERTEKDRRTYIEEAAAAALLLAGLLCVCVQIWYLLNRQSYRIAYMADWMFFLVNGAAILFIWGGGLCSRKLRKFFRKPAVIVFCFLLLTADLAAGALSGGEETNIIRFSPGWPKKMMNVKISKENGSARLFRPAGGLFVRPAEEFPFTVKGEVKTQWLEKDVCAVTYRSGQDDGIHQFVAAYGDRSDGVSYYYVLTAAAGIWDGPGGYCLRIGDQKIELETPRGTEEYDYDEFLQYGTLAVVFPRTSPRWTLVLNRDCILKGGQSTVEDGCSVTLCRVSMKKTEPVTLKRIMDGGIS